MYFGNDSVFKDYDCTDWNFFFVVCELGFFERVLHPYFMITNHREAEKQSYINKFFANHRGAEKQSLYNSGKCPFNILLNPSFSNTSLKFIKSPSFLFVNFK